jgi:AraC-like DNA-binding protein/HAMP domain-containing protein
MKRRSFFNRLVLVYTLVVFVPFTLFIVLASEYLRREQYARILDAETRQLSEDGAYIIQCINTIYKVENAIASNNDMADFFLFDDKSDFLTVVNRIQVISGELTRLQLSQPLLYGIRIFVKEKRIPERWPVFFHTDRLPSPITEKWCYNYGTELITVSDVGRNVAVAYSNELRFYNRQIGHVQILIRMTDFFPFLYKSKEYYAAFRGDKILVSTPDRPDLYDSVYEGILENTAGKESGVIFAKKNKKQIFVFYRVPQTDLLLVKDCSAGLNFRSFVFFRLTALLSIVSAYGLAFVSVRFVTRKMTAKLHTVVDNIQKIESGKMNVMLEVEGDDEISDMARTFARTISELIEQRIKKIVETSRLVGDQIFLDISPSHVFYFVLLFLPGNSDFKSLFLPKNKYYVIEKRRNSVVLLVDEQDCLSLELETEKRGNCIALSRPCASYLGLAEGWREMQIASFGFFLTDSERIFRYQDDGEPALDRNRPYMKIQRLITSLSSAEAKDIQRVIEDIFTLSDIRPNRRSEYLQFLRNCLVLQASIYYGNYIEKDPYLDIKRIMLENPQMFSSLEEWKKHAGDFMLYLNLILKKEVSQHSFIDEALVWIHEHFAEDISMAQAAHQVSANYSYFSEKFKEQTGCHFSEYLTQLRINLAKMLLETGYYTVNEVSFRSGFRDVKYFGKIFKNQTGISPGAYRQKNFY